MKIHVVLSLVLSHNHVTWLDLLKRNSDRAPLLENSPQTEGMGRILHKGRKWGEPSIFGGRNEYSTCEVTAELSSKGIPPEIRFWLTPQEEDMRRIFRFRRIKGVLQLRIQGECGVGFLSGLSFFKKNSSKRSAWSYIFRIFFQSYLQKDCQKNTAWLNVCSIY